jgi:phosphoserine phosphatase
VYRAVLFDLDGTLTSIASVWGYIHRRLDMWHGRADRHMSAFQRGDITYDEFCALDAGYWRGLPVARLESIVAEIELRDGCRELMRFLRQAGLRIGVISTGLTLLADRVAVELAADFCVANHLESKDGRFTGEVDIRVMHRRKDEAVETFCQRFGVAPEQVIAVGDSEGDLSMFRSVGFSIAFRPTDSIASAAADRVCRGDRLTDLIPLLPLGGGRTPGPA